MIAPPNVNVNAWVAFLALIIGAIGTISLIGVKAYFSFRTEADKAQATYLQNHQQLLEKVAYTQGRQDVLQDYTKSQSRQIAQVRDQTQALALAANAPAPPSQAATQPTPQISSEPFIPGFTASDASTISTRVSTSGGALGAQPMTLEISRGPELQGGTGVVGEPPFEKDNN